MIGAIKRFFSVRDVEKDVLGNTPRKIHSTQKALEVSVKEAAAADFSIGVGDNYATPFALALNATPFQVGVLSSLSGFASPVAQLFGSSLMARRSRKHIVMWFVLLQVICWLPMALLGIAYYYGLFQSYSVYLFISLFLLYTIFYGIAMPSWFSWMGDLVPEHDRGRYFGIRNRAGSVASIVAVIIGAFLLDLFKTRGLALIGFSILFFLASLSRFISYLYFHKQYSPRFKVKKSDYFSLWSFVKRFDNFGKFTFYKFSFFLSLYVASPFFAVYMLKELHFSYVSLMVVTISSSVFYLIFSPILGRFADRFGNVKLLYVSNFLFALNPVFWIFFDTPLGLIFVPQLVSGLANAALILATTNFVYDSVSPQKRGICVAYKNLFVGAGTFLGSLIGGLLIKYSSFFGVLKPYFFIFIVAAVLRFLVGIIILPMIKEERKTECMPHFKLNLAHPFKTIHADLAWFRAITKK